MSRTFWLALSVVFAMVNIASADHIWLNEIHYDNAGGDVNEFIEVGLRNPNGSGFTASDYVIELYNGNNGELYNTTGSLDTFDSISAPLAVAGSVSTVTFYSALIPGIQNGSPDGFALVNQTNSTVEAFYSYEGTFVATNGTADGLTSLNLDVFEDGATALGSSLGAIGTGDDANDFSNTSFAVNLVSTPGTVNNGQVLSAVAIPEPSSLALLGLTGCAGFIRRRR